MKIYYILENMRKDVNVNFKMFLRSIFNLKYRNSRIENLIKNKLVFNIKLDFKDKSDGFSAVNLKFLLTEHGFRNSDLILKLLNNFLQIIHNHIFLKKPYETLKKRLNNRFK